MASMPDMPSAQMRIEALARTNPLFGPRKLKLGTFCSNVSSGGTMSTMEGTLQANWDDASAVSRLADEMEFEAVVPIARWRGFGGQTDFNGGVLEALTFAAGMSAQTTYPSIFATVHVPSMHPVMAAKQVTTIDHISRGRFTLNVVTGWNRRDVELFGSPLLDHDQRFVVADEWITLMKLLWTSDVPIDFEGKYFHVRDALLKPRPIQPYPALMNASTSPAGKAFAAKHFDIVFTRLTGRDPASLREQLDSYRRYAREEFGRELKVWVNSAVFLGDTQEDADRLYDYCVNQKGDREAVGNMLTEMGLGGRKLTPAQLEDLQTSLMAGYGGFMLKGTKERIVDELQMLYEVGIDGTLLNWPAYVSDMGRFKEEVYPLLVQEGLR